MTRWVCGKDLGRSQTAVWPISQFVYREGAFCAKGSPVWLVWVMHSKTFTGLPFRVHLGEESGSALLSSFLVVAMKGGLHKLSH